MMTHGWKAGLMLLALSLPAFAQPSPDVACNQDSNNATRYIGSRNSARTADGQLLVVFEPGAAYTDQNIYWTLYDPAGSTWSTPLPLSNALFEHTGSCSVVSDEDGNIHAYWKELNAVGDRDAMYATWTGSSWSTPVVADDLANNAGMGTIAVSSDGRLFNLWSTWDYGTNYDANIYSGVSDDGGVTWQTDNLTSTFPSPDQLPLSYLDVCLAAGPNGTMVAAWEDQPDGSSWECLYAHYDGTEWQTPVIASTMTDSLGILKYADGCTPREEAQAVHVMGPPEYVNAGKACSVYYDSGTSRTLSTFFNIRYVAPVWNRDELVADVVTYFAPASILVVNDDNRFYHTDALLEALDAASIAYDVYETDPGATGTALSPDAATLLAYDFVIWFCGDDGGNIAYWEEGGVYEMDNPDVMAYLDGGGDLWTIGLDFLYDRYAGAPDSFVPGDYCYDYLGLESYDVQSWSNDANAGLPQADVAPLQTITDVGPLYWGVGGLRQGEPSVTVDPAGTSHMVYTESSSIYHRSLDGATWSEAVKIDITDLTVPCMRSCIVHDDQGGLYVTWTQKTNVEPDLWNIFYATSVDGGSTWATPVQLSQATVVSFNGYSTRNPSIGIDVRPPVVDVFEGGADVTWVQWNAESELGFDIMYGRIPFLGLNAVLDLEIVQTAGSVNLSWAAVADASEYNIYVCEEGYGMYTLLGTAIDGATSYSTPVMGDHMQYFRVTAVR